RDKSWSPSGGHKDFDEVPMSVRKPTAALLPQNMTPLERQLMYHFTTAVAGTVPTVLERPGAKHVMQIDLPRLALQNDFMKECLLGLASLHLSRVQADPAEFQALTVAHRVNAFRGLRNAIAHPSIVNFPSILATSLF